MRKSAVSINTEAYVLRITAGGQGDPHRIEVLMPNGFQSLTARFIILAMGCFEASAGVRQIAKQRPSGIYTTGALQQLVNLYHQKPGAKAVAIGSEHIALSSLITLKRAGLSIAAMIEEEPALKTYHLPAQVMRRYYGCDIYSGASVHTILGEDRVEGIEMSSNGDEQTFRIDCDTVILTGKFRPDSQLIAGTSITSDPYTQGPLNGMNFMTSVPGNFAAGNILIGAQMHDLCALEGKVAARGILKRLQASEPVTAEGITIQPEAPIRYIVPQKISPVKARPHFFSRLYPGYSLQMENTVNHPVLEVWSGNEILWRQAFRRLIANNRVPRPVHKFDWNRVDPKKESIVRLQDAEN